MLVAEWRLAARVLIVLLLPLLFVIMSGPMLELMWVHLAGPPQFFDPNQPQRDPIFWQHILWFLGHPETFALVQDLLWFIVFPWGLLIWFRQRDVDDHQGFRTWAYFRLQLIVLAALIGSLPPLLLGLLWKHNSADFIGAVLGEVLCLYILISAAGWVARSIHKLPHHRAKRLIGVQLWLAAFCAALVVILEVAILAIVVGLVAVVPPVEPGGLLWLNWFFRHLVEYGYPVLAQALSGVFVIALIYQVHAERASAAVSD